MTTEPRYPPDGGTPRCPICDAPYQTCTHDAAGGASTDPLYAIDIRLPRFVSSARAPRRYMPAVRSQAIIGPVINRDRTTSE